MAEPGQEPLAVGALRAAREEGAFSYRNARIADIDHGELAFGPTANRDTYRRFRVLRQ